MKKNLLMYFLFTSMVSLSFSDDFVLVENGTFQMGDEQNWAGGEIPVHPVAVDSFYMSRFELTFDEYDNFCLESDRSKPDDEGWGRGRRPVINISWYDAIEYCNWLSDLKGLQRAYSIDRNTLDPNNENIDKANDRKWLVLCDFSADGYRLPTEAEWAFAARGGAESGGYRYSGSNNPTEVGWWKLNSGTEAVARKKPNELGLYDMTGNAQEMCWDWFNKDYYIYSPSRNPTGPSIGTSRAIRGGNWNHPIAGYIRLTHREAIAPEKGNLFTGVRLVRSVVHSSAVSLNLVKDTNFMQSSRDSGIEFKNMEVAGGFALLRDSKGFMWFGSQTELTRFDGFNYKTYNNIPFDKTSLSGNAVYSLLEDSFGNFWVGTAEDLCFFDRERELFTHYKNNPDDPSSLPAGRVFSLFEDTFATPPPSSGEMSMIEYEKHRPPSGNIWIGTDSGFCVYNREKNAFELILPDPGTVNDYYAENYPIYADISGTIWFGTSQGLYKLIDKESHQFEHFAHDPSDPASLGSNEVTSITGDQSGNLWIGTWGDGVNRLNTRTMTFSTIIPDAEYLDGMDTSKITSILSDSDGSILIGMHDAGVVRYDPWKNLLTPLIYGREDVSINRISSLYRDPSDVLWVGIHGFGTVRYDKGVRIFSSADFNEWVLGIAEDDNGLIWISGEMNGIYTFNRETEILTSLSTLPGVSEIFSYPSYGILCDSNGNIWSSTASNGLHRFNPETLEVLESFYHDPDNEKSLSSNSIGDLHEGSDGNFWITTTASGLNKYDPSTGEFTIFRSDPENPASLSNDEMWCILEDSRGNLWLGTTTSLDRLDKGSDVFLHFTHDTDRLGSISNDWVLSILEDSSGDIWFTTWGGGVNRYDYETDAFTFYMKKDGLSGNIAADILEDTSGNLWIGTIDGGVSKFNRENESFVNYTFEDGILGGSNGTRSELVGRDGTIYMSSGRGFIYFDPLKDFAGSYNPEVIITSMSIFEEEKELEKLITFYEKTELSYDENFFSFEFSAFEFAKPEKLQFAYKLEGWDQNWNDSGDRRFASYTNIPGGSYTFLVKALNSDGFWVPEEKYARLQINIETHPLKTWWAISLYFLATIAFLAILFLRYHTVQNRKLSLERQVSDRLRNVDNLKDQFLANTTHELRTPLNGIIGLAESLIDNSNQEISEGTKKELSLIASSGRRLSFLINDILDLSRLKEGDISLNRGPVNLARLVNTVLVLSKPLLTGKDVRLVNEISDDLPLADGDINRVQQIFHNLIGNAVKFTPYGEISLSAETMGSFIRISVKDSGIGIPAEKQEIIWQSFQQIDGSTDRVYSGTGLGLPITKQLVELHGGTISVESAEGEGSEFLFSLPVSHQTESSRTETSIATVISSGHEAERVEANAEVLIKASVLLVDDEAVNRHVVESQLRGKGYRLTAVSSGADALEFINMNPPDLVLLDIMMPVMDGYEVCRSIRENYTARELPVIMITAKNQVPDLVEGLSVGASDYITKPYSGRELVARIKTHLDLKKTNDEFGRFIPEDFLKLLGNESGEPSEKEMTVLFTSFSADNNLKNTDIFSFLSSFLPEVLPVIRKNGGVIYRYEGEGVLSFFPESSADAVNASLEIQLLLDRFNRKLKAGSQFHINSTIHGEKMLFGVAGDEHFSDELVISGAVNQTLKLNDMAKYLGCSIVAGESVIKAKSIEDEQMILAFLYWDEQQSYIKVYELFPYDSYAAQMKRLSSSEYEEGLNLFYTCRFDAASVWFGEVLNINPDDNAAQIYKSRCLYYLNHPPESDIVTLT